MKKIERFVSELLKKEISFWDWIVIFASVIGIRIFIEFFISFRTSLPPVENLMEYLHNFLFFLIFILLVWLIAAIFAQVNPQKMAFLFSWASLLIIFPPILDMIKTGGEVYWSFYVLGSLDELLGQFLFFFGKFPSGIVYFGTKVLFLTVLLGSLGLIWFKTKSLWRSVLGFFSFYIAIFILGSFPSWFILIRGFLNGANVSEIKGFHAIQFFSFFYPIFGIKFENLKYTFPYNLNLIYFFLLIILLTILFFFFDKKKFIAVLKNFRYPQFFYLSGLFLAGMGLGGLAFPENLNINLFSIVALFNLLLCVWLAWKASVIVNDIYDFKIDLVSNQSRPLQKKIFTMNQYAQLGLACFLLSLLGGLIIGVRFAVILIIFQAVAWFYSAKPLRLKRFLGVATLTSSVASILILFLGFSLFSAENNLYGLSPRIIFLLMITYTLCLPIKDFKDIAGDKADGVQTVPVIFGEKNGRLIVAVSFFISYMLSVFLLNEVKLFIWALVFGVVSFFVITRKEIKPYNLLWWNLALVFLYGLILVKIVFL